MKQKGFAQIVIIILLLVLIGGVAYFGLKQTKMPSASVQSPVPSASSNPVIPANWKTYTNDKYKFSFQYPESWSGPVKVSGTVEQGQAAFEGQEGTILIYWGGGFGGGNCPSTIIIVNSGMGKMGYCPVNNPNGTKMLRTAYEGPLPQGFSQIYVQATFNNPFSQNEATVNQILSTFKFVEQTNPSLKTYNDPILDISLEYPSDWTLKTGSYVGDIALEGDGACDYIAKFFPGYLKDQAACSDSTIKNYNPGLTLGTPDGNGSLGFAGPTSGLGGGCQDCIPNTPRQFSINGKSYTINTSTNPPANILFSTLFPQPVGILAGSKSVWNKFDINLFAKDQQTFETEISILQSIKYNSQ